MLAMTPPAMRPMPLATQLTRQAMPLAMPLITLATLSRTPLTKTGSFTDFRVAPRFPIRVAGFLMLESFS